MNDDLARSPQRVADRFRTVGTLPVDIKVSAATRRATVRGRKHLSGVRNKGARRMMRSRPWIVPLAILLLSRRRPSWGCSPIRSCGRQPRWRGRSGKSCVAAKRSAISGVSTWRAFAGFVIGGGISFLLGMINGLFPSQRETDRRHTANGAQYPASGPNPVRYPMVRHRWGSQGVPRGARE